MSLDYTAHEADSDDDYDEQEEYTVEKILAKRPIASAPGGVEFKVRWRGYGLSQDISEPVCSFVQRINTALWSMSAGTRRSSGSLIWKLSPVPLKPWATDPRPELFPKRAD